MITLDRETRSLPIIGQLDKCRACRLCKTRHRVVAGRGVFPADVLIMGEAPGKSEDLIGTAFIGVSGKLLDKMLMESGLNRYRIAIINTVMCQPIDKAGKNRDPERAEVEACRSRIMTLIKFARPRVVIFAGTVSKRYYGRLMPAPTFSISHPSFILQYGGETGAMATLNEISHLLERGKI